MHGDVYLQSTDIESNRCTYALCKRDTVTNLREKKSCLRQKTSVRYTNKDIGAQVDQEGERNVPYCGRRHDRCFQYISDMARYPYPWIRRKSASAIYSF